MDRRRFLLAAPAWAFAPAALARTPLDGEAQRLGPDRVAVTWTAAVPAVIRVSSNPDARPGSMRLVRTRGRSGRAEVEAAVAPRPYFLVIAADGRQTRVAERLLPLEGGRNFRDLGGYRTADGRQVRWGKLFRSGVMSALTPADIAYLSDLGVRVICDFRSAGERQAAPAPFHGGSAPQVVATDYQLDSLALRSLGRARTREEAVQVFADAYVDFTRVLAPQYADMFARLARAEAPLAFNCSAGKDRTGIAAALLLSVLGVPRRTILADYALTEVYAPVRPGAAGMGLPPEQTRALSRFPPEVLAVMGGSDPAVMERALAIIDQRYGGPAALAKARFGVTEATAARLRRLYLA